MAQVCEMCGKKPQFGNSVSHAHNVARRRWNVNLQPVKAATAHGNRRIRVCAACIRAGKVIKPIHAPKKVATAVAAKA